ncbi:hypothetical protein HHK36_002109 [Tetracentron sinense]|uniref:F-box protein n=1 Tax=Tetracentron sinense TaxID=13715 RepID=A0A834ZUJ7_TETSI|nr:hypothetical protein HHK36_002109 [Tetracentron sinense]
MTTLQSSSLVCSSAARGIRATLQAPKLRHLSMPKLPTRDLVEELNMRSGYTTTTQIEMKPQTTTTTTSTRDDNGTSSSKVIRELYAIMESAADRAEMHTNMGEQRDNWNHLLLTSINAITVAAATMAGIAASGGMGAPLVALKLSSTLLYSAATGMLLVMNKIQPSQLAEEQRNAARLFKQLHGKMQTTRFPCSEQCSTNSLTVEPAVWWPQLRGPAEQEGLGGKTERNGWSGKLEEEMREIVGVLKRKDTEEYMRLSKIVLNINKILAISGPLLTGLAAVGSAFVGSPHGSWAVFLGVVAGALASVVNTLEHGGQVGMVFEMYRSSAGFFRLMEEEIESNLKEREVERRENGKLFEMKVALQLGRSLSELKDLAASSSRNGKATKEFGTKLF